MDFIINIEFSLNFPDFLKISVYMGDIYILLQHQHRKLGNISSIPKYQQAHESCKTLLQHKYESSEIYILVVGNTLKFGDWETRLDII